MRDSGDSSSAPATARPYKLRRSCEACRAAKARCCPSEDGGSRCQKCSRDARDCVFAETQPRPKRLRTSRTRVAEMEEKLNSLMALLSSEGHSSHVTDLAQPPPSYQHAVPAKLAFGTIEQLRPQVRPVGLSHLLPPLSPWAGSDELLDVIGKGIISSEDAEACLLTYKANSSNFSFVSLRDMTLDSIRREKPCVLLAILSVVSASSAPDQRKIEVELRENLGQRAIVNGEKSIDLCQGLLIYLTWYQYYFSVRTQQCYRLSQLLAAMAVELSTPNLKPGHDSAVNGENGAGSPDAKPTPTEIEMRRTFLGCYYISSCCATALRKPSTLKYTDFVEKCCREIIEMNECETDRLLPYIFQLVQLAEEVTAAFDYDGHQQLPELDVLRIEMLTKNFNRQLQQFKECFPTEAWGNVAISSAYNRLKIYISEISLHAFRPKVDKLVLRPEACRSWYASVARSDILLSCLAAAKSHVEFYLNLSLDQLLQNTALEDSDLIYALMILIKFTSGVDSPFIEASDLRNSSNLIIYLDRLIALTSNLVPHVHGQVQRDYFSNIHCMCRRSKHFIEEQIQGNYYATLDKAGIPKCIDFDACCNPKKATQPPPMRVDTTEIPYELEALPDDLWNNTLDDFPISLDPYMASLSSESL